MTISDTGDEEEPVFHAPAGRIVGWRDGDMIRATNIAYATARRFQPPEPVAPSDQTIAAKGVAPACPQKRDRLVERLVGIDIDEFPTSEDCLNLSICRPAVPTADAEGPLPVMVWIHGGSYITGAGDLPCFDPAPLVREQGVIVVSLTYRLGVFGFLGGADGRPANLGLLDMIAALAWVRSNIAAFGGDPDRITLFGESAGGDAIAHLMIAEGTEGLFRRAIIQSAPLGIARKRASMNAKMMAMAGALDETSSIDEMLRVQKACESVGRRHGTTGLMPFGVQYGHHPLPPEAERDAVWKSRSARFDLLIGTNAEECRFFLPFIPPLQRLSRLRFGGHALALRGLAMATWSIYRKGSARLARLVAASSGKALLYRLNFGRGQGAHGACHAIDMPLLFADYETWRQAEMLSGIDRATFDAAARQLRAHWAGFARNGEPAEPADPHLIEFERLEG